ncbi:unnamed protein product [Peniophora sp. CBMAI 1063]|nr:unnamed protein product [Peniophora sp. CBMAI 1063]
MSRQTLASSGEGPDRTSTNFTERWPIELWLNVFDLAYPIQTWDPRLVLRDSLSLSWVCTRWRQATIGYTQFWSTIVLDWHSELLELYIRRSGDHPLHVYFNPDQGDPDFIDEERHTIQRNFRQVFGDAFNMGRIRRMDLTVLDTSLNIVLDEYVSQHEAHALETFIYNTENYGLRRRPAFARAFSGIPPPRLRCLTLSGDKIPVHSPILSPALQDLTLDGMNLGGPEAIFGVLQSLPSLNRLRLLNSLDDLRNGNLFLGTTVELPYLENLELGDETLAVVNFVRRLHVPHLQDFQVSIMHESLTIDVAHIRNSITDTFTAVGQMLIFDADASRPSYNELRVRFGVMYSHLEFILSGGQDGLPERLHFSFHDTDYLDEFQFDDSAESNPNIVLVRHGLRELPFVSNLQSLVIGPTVDFTSVDDWTEALEAIPHIQAVHCMGADGAYVALGLARALRARPTLFARLTRISLFNFLGSASNFDQELGAFLTIVAEGSDDAAAIERESPLELSIEGRCNLPPETLERLRRVLGVTSVRVSKG